MDKSSASAGFTLVEMLVTLSLLSLLGLLMIATVPQLKAFQRLTESNDTQMELDSVANFIAGEIAEARRLPLMGQDNQARIVLDGGPSSISFVAVVRAGSAQFALKDLTIASSGGKLVAMESARRQATSPGQSYGLTDSSTTMTLSYCATQNDGTSLCRDSWREWYLPDYISLELTTMANGTSFTRLRIVTLENVR